MFSVIAGIVLEGLKIFSDERRTRIQDEYYDILSALRRAENAKGKNYFDSDIDLLNEKLEGFLIAYHKELKAHNDKNA